MPTPSFRTQQQKRKKNDHVNHKLASAIIEQTISNAKNIGLYFDSIRVSLGAELN